jgi:hypothetical protein
MVYKEAIIGFDCREMWLPNVESWTEEVREQTLLRQDIERRLSAGKPQWNSLFVFKNVRVDGRPVGSIPDTELEIPTDHIADYTAGFWSNLDAMRIFMNDHSVGIGQKPYWMIAITLVETPSCQTYLQDKKQNIFGDLHNPLFQTRPPVIDSQWIFLGYDVEDDPPSMWEGLNDGGYGGDMQQELREKYGKHLNQYHLFDEQEPANEYCKLIESWEGHPYFVYGLYLIEKYPKDDASL